MFKPLKILIFLMLIAGCAERREKAITFAVGGAPNEIQFWEKLSREFQEQTGIRIKILRQPTDSDQRRQGLLIPLKAKKSDPDVFLLDVAWIGQFSSSGWLLPLDDYLSEYEIDINVFFTQILNSVDRYKGELIALPVYLDAGLLYYRKDLLKKYGYARPPQTWQELLEMGLKIQAEERKKNPDFFGFVWQGAQYEGLVCNFLEFSASAGGGIFLKKGKISLAGPENVEALRLMRDLIHKYKISPPNTFTEMKEEEVRLFFQQGNALFERNWPYAWALHQSSSSKVKDRVGISALPHFPDGRNVSALGGWHIAVSRYSDSKQESIEFLKYVISYQTQKKLAENLGWNPARQDLYQDQELLAELPHLEKLSKIFEQALARPNLPYYSLISEVLQRYLNSALSRRLKPREALVSAEKEIEKIIQRYEKD